MSPGAVSPGDRLLAEAVLTSRSETPVDFVAIRLRGTTQAGVGSGKSRAVHTGSFFEREWRSKSMKMAPGEHRFKTLFELGAGVPPTYVGQDTSITYTITVHVSIPWWPDREQDFVVPVAFAPVPPLPPSPKVFVTARDGPRGKDPFMELSLDATQIAVGDVVSGSISVQNLRGRRIRGVDLSFVETETITLPSHDVREGQRFRLRVLDGAPTEGAAIPFRVAMPDSATPSFSAGTITLATDVEVRADVAWGHDVALRARVLVSPRASAPRADRGWVAPVGSARQALVWQNVAAKVGLVTDPEAKRMVGRAGRVTVEVSAEQHEDYWLVAKLAWPSLGLELDVGERRWSDALAVSVVRSGDAAVDGRFSARAREHAQAQAFVAPDVLGPLLRFGEVTIGDAGARLAVRGAAHVTEKVERFVRRVLEVAAIFDRTLDRVPPPAMFAADVPAWQALAARLRGRLELGRMWIHDAVVGASAVQIGSVWARGGLLLGSAVIVAIDPPLDAAPAGLEDPALSPAARAAWRELAARAKNVEIRASAINVELEGKLSDPETALPVAELAVSLRRALGGLAAAGPFR
ncbi:MAG: hypothetical protein KF764_14865 [Labilithrix sp.]|nr:hypothetical protein [Labilithrix sp.]